MSKRNGNDYQKICLFCESASILKGGNGILCKYKGIVDEDNTCRKYVYDPLKRQPKAPPKLQTLTKEDII